jgi:hypothetical protein
VVVLSGVVIVELADVVVDVVIRLLAEVLGGFEVSAFNPKSIEYTGIKIKTIHWGHSIVSIVALSIAERRSINGGRNPKAA